jgi:DNA primase
MQKNIPKYAPEWIETTAVWAEASHREVHYPICKDRRTLLWYANQRAVEYHPTLVRVGEHRATHLILDLDPPAGATSTTWCAPPRWCARRCSTPACPGR